MRPEGVDLSGEQLRQMRYLRRLTQAQVAEKIEVSESHYRALETNRGRASRQTVARLEKLFETALEEL